MGTNGTDEGKVGLLKMFKDELSLNRSYFEISGPLLKFLSNNLGKQFIKSYAISFNNVEKILENDKISPVDNTDEHVKMFPDLQPYFYQREIGGHFHTKIMLGSVGNIFKF